MQENQNTTVELVPDEDGFLFEIDDDLYILGRIIGLLMLSIIFLILMIIKDFELMDFAHSGYRGHYLVYIALPFMILESIRIPYYFYKKNYKKIKFYETYILKTNKNIKVELKDIKEGYFLKFNFEHSLLIRNYSFLLFIYILTILIDYKFIFFYPLIILYFYLIFALSRYIYSFYKGNKTLFTDNIMLIGNDNKHIVSVPLQIINQEDKIFFESYIKKYFNKNIEEFEKYKFKIPISKTENLINTETKIGENNGR